MSCTPINLQIAKMENIAGPVCSMRSPGEKDHKRNCDKKDYGAISPSEV